MKHFSLFIQSIRYSLQLVYRSSKLTILLYFVLDLISTTFPLVLSFVLKYLLDVLTAEKTDMTVVVFCVGVYVVILVTSQILNSLKEVTYDSVFKKAEHLYDCDLSSKLAKLPMSFIDTSEGKDVVDEVRYTKNAAVYLTYRMVRILSLLYAFGVAFGTLITFNVWFSLLFLVLTVPGIILDIIFSQKSMELRQRTAPDVRKFCYYRWMLTDGWPAKDVRMYDLTEQIKTRYDSEKKEYIKENKNLDIKELIAALLTELIIRCGEIAFTVFIVLQALAGEISVGDVTLYIGLAISASSAFQTMITIFLVEYIETTEMMDKVFLFMGIQCQDEYEGKRNLEEFESLTFNDVYFKYPLTDKYVLSGVSFTLNQGDKLSIIGVNGSGKSTIIKLMLGLYEIDSGEILINGYPISDYNIMDVRKLYSALFQDFVQYPLTLRENIALSDYENANNDVEIVKALKQSGVYDELQIRLEKGFDSYMTRQFDNNGIELSKGQWQKVALSRVYFKNAPIIIFDEPSAALDAEAEDQIFKNFEEISEKKTGIMISHRISAARMANKVIVLDRGVIVEQGTHDELVNLDGLYAKLYNLQKEKYAVKEVE